MSLTPTELTCKGAREAKMTFPYPIYMMMALYIGCSLPLFNKIYDTTKVVIDEMFHIPQAQAYCDGRYDVWDPKITTLPGLYVAVQLVTPFLQCSTYVLRLFNLAVSIVNMVLFYVMLNIVYGSSNLNIAMQALNMAILPPLYFFSHVFYTDTVSLMFLLLFTIGVIKRSPYITTIFGMASICTRQTNVIWVFMIWCQKLIQIILKTSRVYGNSSIQQNRKRGMCSFDVNPNIIKHIYNIEDMLIACNFHYDKNCLKIAHNPYVASDSMSVIHTTAPMLFFIVFVYFNGSIAVGDKQAHTITVNAPQLLYFLLFYGFFGLPFVLSRIKSTLRFMRDSKWFVFYLGIGFLFVVHFNTIVHPYLLADNRHYTFYIWNRWFGKYPEAIYLTIPVYVFLACSFADNLVQQNCVSFTIAYFFCLLPALCLQRLLELRYFIIPYVIARLRFPRSSTKLVACELIWYLVINAAFFHVFFTKEVKWDDFEEPQRIIW